MTEVIIGSRESKLAVLQSEMVKSYIEQKNREENAGSEITVNILTMKTTGDIILDRTLDKVGGKGLFVKELDRALLDGKSNLSVHSLKDMPMEVPKELPLLAFSKREDPRDVLVLPEGVAELDPDKPLGCSSLRRTLQLKKLYPEMEVKSIRGNLQTRLRKLDEGEYSGLILAAAGLKLPAVFIFCLTLLTVSSTTLVSISVESIPHTLSRISFRGIAVPPCSIRHPRSENSVIVRPISCSFTMALCFSHEKHTSPKEISAFTGIFISTLRNNAFTRTTRSDGENGLIR